MVRKFRYLFFVLTAILISGISAFWLNNAYAAFFGGVDITKHIRDIYLFGSAIVGAIAVVTIAIGGINYMRSMGNAEQVARSKQLIGGAIIGLFLVLGGYFLLRTIDPRLVEFKVEVPELVLPQGLEGDCTQLGSKACDPEKTPVSDCKFTYHICVRARIFGSGTDETASKTLPVTCDAQTKTWRLARNSVCGVNHNVGCVGCDQYWTDDISSSACPTGQSCETTDEDCEDALGNDTCSWETGDGTVYRCKDK